MHQSRIGTSRKLYIALALLILGVPLFAGTRASSQSAPPALPLAALAVVAPITGCSGLEAVDISLAVGAPTHITSAKEMPEGKPAPYCRVTGFVEPMNKFEVRLPLTTWTQRFVQTGCGGLCGNLNINLSRDDGCYPAQHGELVLSSTDMGHTGGNDGEFGENDYQLRIDFAYRGVHVTTLATKALIQAFYGQSPKYSYFAGCSDGGREALMEAQRYPGDFNGITAGAPAMNFVTQNTFYHGWNAIKNMTADGSPVLTVDRLPILHNAAVQACDAADGLKDGLISDPLACHFDPSTIECKAGAETSACLTHAEVETARAIYAGAHSEKGDKFVLSGPLYGSELAWAGVYVPAAKGARTMSPGISAGTLKYLAYEKNPDPAYTLNDLQYTPDSFIAATKLHALYDATDPDLSTFEKAGGKLILWHGLADPHISPLNTIAYYTAMNRVMGEKSVQKFARLYLFPGGYHCAGGEGPFDFDLMSAIMAWVEKDAAPFVLVASHKVGGSRGPGAGGPGAGGQGAGGPGAGGAGAGGAAGAAPGGARSGVAPADGPPADVAQGGGMPAGGPPQDGGPGDRSAPGVPAKVDRTRPIYPYPLTAKYTGTGSIDEATNFVQGPAKPATAAQLQWMGSSFYMAHYETWCDGHGASMTCKPKP